MVFRKKCSLVLLFFILFPLFFSFWGINTLQAGPELAQETLAIMLVIDVSGSMRYTDPQMLRETTARIFIDLLSPEDYLGIITFDHNAGVVIPLQQVGSAANKERFKNTLAPELQPRGNTDFLKALEAAYAQFQETDTGSAKPAVVLLTDGDPDPDPARSQNDPAFMPAYMESLWRRVGGFALEGCPIYTVGLGEEIDPEIISRLSIDTKGDYYLLNEPGELLVSFFKLLGNLKNRRNLPEETFELEEGIAQEVEFEVSEYTRQVNLVAVNLSGGSCALSLVSPKGEADSIEGITVNNHGNYSMAILSGGEKENQGNWKALLSGSGQVRLMGDMDLLLKAWLEEPQPSSQHPANEPVHLKVTLTGGEELHGLPLSVEVQVFKPDSEEPEVVSLLEEGGCFKGTYEGADRAGTYELLLRLLLDGEVVSTVSSRLYVRVLPSLVTDFWTDEGYRLGEEIIVTGSMELGGKRLVEGSELAVDQFSLLLDCNAGEDVLLQLFDDGSLEHGDIRPGDGIWSNRLNFNLEGPARASLRAVGEYAGTEFFLEKQLGTITVHPPGAISLKLSKPKQWGAPGQKVTFPLTIENNSLFRETLFWEPQHETGSFNLSKIVLEPGDTKRVNLDFSVLNSLEPRLYSFPVVFTAENNLTAIEPSKLEFSLEILTPGEAFFRNFYYFILLVLFAAAVILVGGLVVFIIGLLLYRFLVYPQKKVGGVLMYWKIDGSDGSGEELPNKIRLGKRGKDTVTISFDPNNKKADFYIKGSEFNYDIIIRKVWDKNYRPFIQGWKALLQKSLPLRLMLNCTPPGIIEFEGEILTGKELFHSDKFESGGFAFEYVDPYGKWFQDNKAGGVDLLDGRV
jgi:Mg-chelatase subunit ChlD